MRPIHPSPAVPDSRKHRRIPGLAVLATCLAIAPAARAQAGAECRPDGNQAQMNACAVRDFQAADAQLNIRYGEAMARLDADGRVRLRQAQRAWLRGRDPTCKDTARVHESGPAWPLHFHACLEEATVARTRVLQDVRAPRADASRR